jgi:hypothetical protein
MIILAQRPKEVGVPFNRWMPNRWDLLTLCALAVLVCWPWLGVLAFLFGHELQAIARRVLRRRPNPPATPPPSGAPATSSLSAAFGRPQSWLCASRTAVTACMRFFLRFARTSTGFR